MNKKLSTNESFLPNPFYLVGGLLRYISQNIQEAILIPSDTAKEVRQSITDGHITISDYNSLNKYSREALKNESLRKFLIAGHITIRQIKNFFSDPDVYDLNLKYNALKRTDLQQFILDGNINIAQFVALSSHACNAISKTSVRNLVLEKHISIERFLTLPGRVCIELAKPNAYQLVANKIITIDELSSGLTIEQIIAPKASLDLPSNSLHFLAKQNPSSDSDDIYKASKLFPDPEPIRKKSFSPTVIG